MRGTERRYCGACDSDRLELVLDLGSSPLADAFPTTPDAVEQRYPLRMLVCRSCWLAQIGDVVRDDALWTDYGFYSSTSPALVEYHRAWVQALGVPEPQLTVEIACNDGSLLAHLPGRHVVGVDPAQGPAAAARARGLDVWDVAFGPRVADQIKEQYGPADLVVALNVAAHVADLPGFLRGIRLLLAPDGLAVLEVQSLMDLMLGNQIDHLYHEHRFYFSLQSLTRALWAAGLAAVSVERTPMQGGSLRIVCRRARGVRSFPTLDGEAGFVDSMTAFSGLQARAETLRENLWHLLSAEVATGRKVAGFAATAKSTTLLNWCGIGPETIGHIEDTTPHKIGRFTPGTHIPIVAPGDRPPPDTYLMLAWNYLGRALRADPFPGRWLVPIPQPVIL